MSSLHFDCKTPIFDQTSPLDRPLCQALMLVHQVGAMAVELFKVPWVLQAHSTGLGPLQFLLEHSLTFTTIYSLKCQLSPPPNPCPPHVSGVETAKISEYIIQKLAGEFGMGTKFFVLYTCVHNNL